MLGFRVGVRPCVRPSVRACVRCVCLSVCLFVCLVCPSVHSFVRPFCQSIPSVRSCVCPSVRLSVCLPVRLSDLENKCASNSRIDVCLLPLILYYGQIAYFSDCLLEASLCQCDSLLCASSVCFLIHSDMFAVWSYWSLMSPHISE